MLGAQGHWLKGGYLVVSHIIDTARAYLLLLVPATTAILLNILKEDDTVPRNPKV
jgi:hypothetical protein